MVTDKSEALKSKQYLLFSELYFCGRKLTNYLLFVGLNKVLLEHRDQMRADENYG